jgi:hypothetical protein
MRHTIVAFLISVVLLLVAGCGGGGGAHVAASDTASPYTITGKVSLNGAGLGQVSMAITGAASQFSDGNGNYSFTTLSNGNYTITPSRSGYSFTPASKTVTINNNGVVADFAASAIPTFAVSGKVGSANGAGLAGVTVAVADAVTGASSGSKVTDGNGSYSISGLTSGNYVLTPSHSSGYSFTPASQTVAIQNGNVTAEFTAPGVSTFTVSGKVASANGVGLANVSMAFTLPDTGATYSTVTDSSGNYAIRGLPNGYYTLTPSLKGYAFVPDPYLVRINGADEIGKDIMAAPAGSGAGSININI